MPKIVDRDRYRQELLLKCFDLFAEKGYASITMREIAKGLGVSTGTLYHYFPSKKELFWQLVEEQTRRDNEALMAQVGDAQTLSERIEAMFAFHAKFEDYFRKQILLAVDFYQQLDPEEMANNETLKRVWEETRHVEAELLGIQDSALLNVVMCQLCGVLLQRLFGDDVSFAQQSELLGKMLTSYLEHQPIPEKS